MTFRFAAAVNAAQQSQSGLTLASLFSLKDDHAGPVVQSAYSNNWQDQLSRTIGKKGPWTEMAIAHVEVLLQTKQAVHQDVPSPTAPPLVAYDCQAKLSSAFVRWFSSTTNNKWALPILYTISTDLRALALTADAYLAKHGAKPSKLEDAASRHFMKAFSVCIADRGGTLESTRRWGTYHMANLLFKTYFKLRALALCKNIKRAIESTADLPPLSLFPISDQVAYRYHMGVYAFLNELYTQAEEDLEFALLNCPTSLLFIPNRELILSYLIPIRLLKGVLPSKALLEDHPNLRVVYDPLVDAIKTGNVRKYDETLLWAEKRLLDRGTYLAVESAREVCLRRLLKKIWLSSAESLGGTPSARLDLATFKTALNFVGIDADQDEIECILANMIYKNYIKGYLSHTQQKIVLSQKTPFPQIVAAQA